MVVSWCQSSVGAPFALPVRAKVAQTAADGKGWAVSQARAMLPTDRPVSSRTVRIRSRMARFSGQSNSRRRLSVRASPPRVSSRVKYPWAWEEKQKHAIPVSRCMRHVSASMPRVVGSRKNRCCARLNWGWLAEGLYRSEDEIDNSAWYGTRPNLGDIKYKDLNGDGEISWQDRGIFGRSNRPELTFGLNVNMGWNGFDMNLQFTGGALFQVSMTGTYFNENDDDTIWTKTFKEGANSPLFLVENAYSLDNPTGTFPRLTLGTTGHGGDNGLRILPARSRA